MFERRVYFYLNCWILSEAPILLYECPVLCPFFFFCDELLSKLKEECGEFSTFVGQSTPELLWHLSPEFD